MTKKRNRGAGTTATTSAGIPVGKLTEFEGSVLVESANSLQQQYIPKGAKEFKDFITKATEEVTKDKLVKQ